MPPLRSIQPKTVDEPVSEPRRWPRKFVLTPVLDSRGNKGQSPNKSVWSPAGRIRSDGQASCARPDHRAQTLLPDAIEIKKTHQSASGSDPKRSDPKTGQPRRRVDYLNLATLYPGAVPNRMHRGTCESTTAHRECTGAPRGNRAAPIRQMPGLPGALVTIWCGLKGWAKDQQRGVYQPFILIMQVLALVAIKVSGRSSTQAGTIDLLTLAYVPVALLGTWCGIRIFRRLTDLQFTRLVKLLTDRVGYRTAVVRLIDQPLHLPPSDLDPPCCCGEPRLWEGPAVMGSSPSPGWPCQRCSNPGACRAGSDNARQTPVG